MNNRNHNTVPEAWRNSTALRQANIHTDGATLWSYNHPIDITEPDGTKVAYACSTTTTTARHSGGAQDVAAVVKACPCHDWSTATAKAVKNGTMQVG